MKKNNLFVVVISVVAGLMVGTANAQWRRATEQDTNAPRTLVVRNAAQQEAAPTRTLDPNSRTTRSVGMLSDNSRAELERVASLTPITVGKPTSIEEMRGYYGGFANYGYYNIGGIYLPTMQYPAFSSLEPARYLPCYIQRELAEEYRRSGNFKPLLAGTGCDGGNLNVVADEARVGRGVLRDVNGQSKRVQIGPDTWTSTETVVVSSVGILEESVRGRQLDGGDVARILDSMGIYKGRNGYRIRDTIWATLGRARGTSVDRVIIAILYVAKIDVQTRTVLDSTTGIAAISYNEMSAAELPGMRTMSVRYPGAGKLARELVMAALYDPIDRDESVEKFLKRRGR